MSLDVVVVGLAPHDPRRRATSPGSWPGSMDLSLFVGAPSAVSPIAGWDIGTHARLTGTCRITQAAPCSPTVRQPNRQTARAATRRAIGLCHPPVAHDRLCGPPLLGVPSRAGPWLCRADGGSVTPAASLAFHSSLWSGCVLGSAPRRCPPARYRPTAPPRPCPAIAERALGGAGHRGIQRRWGTAGDLLMPTLDRCGTDPGQTSGPA
jgi:hypothetical protein